MNIDNRNINSPIHQLADCVKKQTLTCPGIYARD
jgi:hypothetical protein